MNTSITPDILKIYAKKDVDAYISPRAGETKFGEKISFIEDVKELINHPAKYVLLGIPEDIGVRANYGNSGTSKCWEATLGSLLNIQYNHLLDAKNVILLGEINCHQEMVAAASISMQEDHAPADFGDLVSEIDKKVTLVIKEIVAAGKIPIVIGGGHNNSYGNLRGTSEGLNSQVNCINFDAHTDFRTLEHRHSGNGFSYAFKEGFLKNYFIFGLHRNYTSEAVFKAMEEHPDRIQFGLYENLTILKKQTFSGAINRAEAFCCDSVFGIELDMDSIDLMGSSAMTPSGLSLTEAREFVAYFSKHPNMRYVHICEGAPKYGAFPNQVGKAVAYLVSDVISI